MDPKVNTWESPYNTFVQSFISKYRKGSIKGEIPGQYLNMTVEEALNTGNTTVKKLLVDGRFVK